MKETKKEEYIRFQRIFKNEVAEKFKKVSEKNRKLAEIIVEVAEKIIVSKKKRLPQAQKLSLGSLLNIYESFIL